MCSLQVQHLTLMGMELHARNRRDLEPDPEFDPICALFYCISADTSLPDTIGTQLTGTVVINRDHQGHDRGEHFFDHCSVGSIYDQCNQTARNMASYLSWSTRGCTPAGPVRCLWIASNVRH